MNREMAASAEGESLTGSNTDGTALNAGWVAMAWPAGLDVADADTPAKTATAETSATDSAGTWFMTAISLSETADADAPAGVASSVTGEAGVAATAAALASSAGALRWRIFIM